MIRQTLEHGAHEMGLKLTEENLQRFESFVSELKKWNRKINLTAITADKEIAIKHIIDSLVLADYMNDGESVLDIGSGAGIPAIPLKIVKPSVTIASLDAVGKKILFQRHIARMLKLEGFEAIHARAEELQSTRAHQFTTIVSRAFSCLEQFVALAAPLLASGGRIIAMKGPNVVEEITADEMLIREQGFEILFQRRYQLPFEMGGRSMIILSNCSK